MARSYSSAAKRLQEDPAKPFARRTYQMILFDPRKAVFDADHTTAKAITDEKGNEPVDRFGLRIQIIKDPTRPIGDARLLQFFAQDPNRDSLVRGGGRSNSGVIVEIYGSREYPLFMLNADEVWELTHGAGFNSQIITPAVPAAG
jgi:hypothetical protein